MKNETPKMKLSLAAALVLIQAILPLGAREAVGESHFSSSADSGEVFDDLLLSGRMEAIYLLNLTDTIREDGREKSRFYFNNLFLNLEGSLGDKVDYIIEYQPLTSDLYLLGGYLTIAEALEGMGLEEADERKVQIGQLITAKIRELDRASEKASFERAQINFFFKDKFGVKLGRVRNPFGFWDDYSLFRNLSALKTDPVSLGVALRRADLGFVAFGDAWGAQCQFGVLQGENTFINKDVDNFKDAVVVLGKSLGPLDLAANVYLHDIGRDSEPSRALGLSYRYRGSYNLTLLGEFISIENEDIDIATQGFYIQGNYDLSNYLKDGLRWNMFFETYDSDLLDIDLEKNLDYRFAGTYFQGSTGLLYAYNRNIDLGAQIFFGVDEEGDPSSKVALKIDAKF